MTFLRALAVAGLILLAGGGAFVLWQRRAEAAEIERLARDLRLGPGSRIADVGAGKGSFALALARRVGDDGHVFATEIDADLVRRIRAAAEREGLRNVTAIASAAASTGLAPGCCEGIYLRGVYHHLTDPEAIDRGLHEAIEPGGRLVVIDFEPSWLFTLLAPVEGVPENRGGHGVPSFVVAGELEAVGFVLERSIDDWSSRNYALIFRRP
ncbi:MAG TPA: methyltransferase domain-containing protein [Thermoanaerobaculia bacterium]|jgi:ubiquinone/menaquinone biosynthesis C-methylase UbiE|nr:methyltransferase domain-containing protein [Thermoanaerobaculia bacterium]